MSNIRASWVSDKEVEEIWTDMDMYPDVSQGAIRQVLHDAEPLIQARFKAAIEKAASLLTQGA